MWGCTLLMTYAAATTNQANAQDLQRIDLTPDPSISAGSHTTQQFEGRSVWVPNNSNSQLFFDVPDSFDLNGGNPVYVQIEYHDSGYGYLEADYDSRFQSSQSAEIHARSSRVNGGGFVSSYQMFESPRFDGRQSGSNDFRFRLQDSDGTPLRIAGVQISTAPFDDATFQYALSKPWLTPYDGEVHDFVDNQTLSGKVMTGYQGWFRAPNDPADEGWNHWGGGYGRGKIPSAEWMTIDAWPYLDEYKRENLYRAGEMHYKDGRPAQLFSSQDPDTVQRHFRWMRTHGIDGAYLQFFVTANRSGANGAKKFVLNNVMEAAAKEGRIWALEYDISSLSRDPAVAFQTMTEDWTWMVNEAKILEDPRYAHENGKPVLFIWGFSVRDHSIALADAVLDWFAMQDVYLIGGVGANWMNRTEWHAHYQKYDQLLGWMERDLGDLNSQKALLESWGMKILPHAWPGFSWHNLKQLDFPTQYTPRSRGDFYWRRIYNAVASGADQIFLGMFDEYDEATNIMPMSDSHPNIFSDGSSSWGHYINNEARDPFWYVQLSGAAREMLNGLRPLSSSTPTEESITPTAYGGDAVTAYLGPTDTHAGLTLKQPEDGITSGATLGGQDSRINQENHFYFDIDDSIVFSNAEGQAVTIEIEFYDIYANTNFRLQYDGLDGPYMAHPSVPSAPNTGGWKVIRWNLTDGYFGGRQNGNADFRIQLPTGETAAIRRVNVFFPEEWETFHDDRLSINFQPPGAAVPIGALADTSQVFSDRGNGHSYGWATAFDETRERSVHSDQRLDTFNHTQVGGSNRFWEIALPNGDYIVSLTGGDPSHDDSFIEFVAEAGTENAVTLASGDLDGVNFISGHAVVTVDDGRLTISNGPNAANNKINIVDIVSVTGAFIDAYEAWKAEHAITDDLGDEDNDGINNLLEFAFGGDPRIPGSARLPQVGLNGSDLELTLQRERGDAAITYVIEKSTDLIDWETFGDVTDEHGTVGGEATVKIPFSEMNDGKLFLRLRIEK